jgi:hypothetical protein
MPKFDKILKRLKTHFQKLSKKADKVVGSQGNRTELTLEITSKLLGFSETSIEKVKNSELEPVLYEIFTNDCSQFILACYGDSSEAQSGLPEELQTYLYENLHRYCVVTNGFNWSVYKADSENLGTYGQTHEMVLFDTEWTEDNIELLSHFCIETHSRRELTDSYNRKRWYFFTTSDSKQKEPISVLSDVLLYQDGSERCHIPLLGHTIFGDSPLQPRYEATRMILDHLRQTAGKDVAFSSETVAFMRETKAAKGLP